MPKYPVLRFLWGDLIPVGKRDLELACKCGLGAEEGEKRKRGLEEERIDLTLTIPELGSTIFYQTAIGPGTNLLIILRPA